MGLTRTVEYEENLQPDINPSLDYCYHKFRELVILSAIYPWKVGLAKELVNESVEWGKVSLPVLKENRIFLRPPIDNNRYFRRRA